MKISPEDRKRFIDALIALVTVVLSIAGSLAVGWLNDVGGVETPAAQVVEVAPACPDTVCECFYGSEDDFDADMSFGVSHMSDSLVFGFTDETITDGETLTPAYTIYALDSAGPVTMTLGTSGIEEGQLLVLIGDDANTITLTDTNIRTNDGAAQVLGQYDVLFLVFQDNEWLEISESNNS